MSKEWRVGIVSGVVATVLFVYFLDPLLRIVGFFIHDVFGQLFHGYINRLYEQAALLQAPDSSFYLLNTLVMVISGLATGMTTRVLCGHRDASSLPIVARLSSSQFALGLVSIISCLSIWMLSIMMIYGTMFQLRLTSSFNQHIAAIAPYVSDQEVKTLRSRWTQMASESDYTNIYTDLNHIAATNHIRLPDNKVFVSNAY